MRLLDFFAGEMTVREVLNMIDHLPRTSHYSNAVAQDEELAERTPESSGKYEVPLTDWSPEAEALAHVVDRLAEVANSVIVGAGGKPSSVKPYPRPVTAFDRARARRRREAAEALERKLFPQLHEEA